MNTAAALTPAPCDLASRLRRVAGRVCSLVPSAVGVAISLSAPGDRFLVAAATGVAAVPEGAVIPFGAALHGSGSRSSVADIVADTSDDRTPGEVRAISARLGVRSLLNVSLNHDGAVIGMVSLLALAPSAFGEREVHDVMTVCDVLSAMMPSRSEPGRIALTAVGATAERTHREIGTSSPPDRIPGERVHPTSEERSPLRDEIDSLIRLEQLAVEFQPIVDIVDQRVRGFEGLCRFPKRAPGDPAWWFAAAHGVDRGVDLELLAARAVLRAARDIPAEYTVSINLGPTAAQDPCVQNLLLTAGRPVVLELTEHEPIPNTMHADLEELRRSHVRLAVDDAGSGFAGLRHILQLRPDILKLDGCLVAGVETDRVRRALVASLVRFAHEVDATIVAEGIETEQQCTVLRDLGIRWGQGYWLGRPAAPAAMGPGLAARYGYPG